jgi:hypothetical protein
MAPVSSPTVDVALDALDYVIRMTSQPALTNNCPTCGARTGSWCTFLDGHGDKPGVHQERKNATIRRLAE